jgi:DNA-binding transcriptional ArsR family regulator
MPTPLHQLKAEFFKSLGHPLRIRVLELLSDRERSVGEMLPSSASKSPTCPSSWLCCAGRVW